jgi:ankyrin repeat protein
MRSPIPYGAFLTGACRPLPPALASSLQDGVPPLFIASHNGHGEVITALCAASANPNRLIPDGIAPLFAASEGGHAAAVKALLAAGATVAAPAPVRSHGIG